MGGCFEWTEAGVKVLHVFALRVFSPQRVLEVTDKGPGVKEHPERLLTNASREYRHSHDEFERDVVVLIRWFKFPDPGDAGRDVDFKVEPGKDVHPQDAVDFEIQVLAERARS